MDNKVFEYAKEKYASFGVDVEEAMKRVASIPVSIQCWQGDDVRGFENPDGDLTGGIQTTGNYPGRAKNIDQLRGDFEKAISLIPGIKRISLHANYLDNGGKKVDRNEMEPKHFESWVQWGKEKGINLDFNSTNFSHPLSASGFTLSNADENIRKFWIEHNIASRKIAEYIGKEQGSAAITNYWIPDGFKDIPVDRYGYRARLLDSWDQIFKGENRKYNINAIESKVFGIGAESCTIGSFEMCLGYAAKNNQALTLDTGHFHPTEVVSDKISSALLFLDDVNLHVSRPVRWDSDHVVILDDELKYIAQEILRPRGEKKVHVGLDYFDASINRIAAWVIGTRNMQKALLFAALEPTERLKKIELEGDYTSRLALLEEEKTMPFSVIWNKYCEEQNVPVGEEWLVEVKNYEKEVLSKR